MLPMIEDGSGGGSGDGDETSNELMLTSNYASPLESLWDLAKRNKHTAALTMTEHSNSSAAPSRTSRSARPEHANMQVAVIKRLQIQAYAQSLINFIKLFSRIDFKSYKRES